MLEMDSQKMKKDYIKPQIKSIRIIDNISLMSSSVAPAKQDIPFSPDIIPDADEGSYAS